jgi:transcriptional regulator with XRE-family HTH domain
MQKRGIIIKAKSKEKRQLGDRRTPEGAKRRMTQEIGKRLREIRKNRGITLTELAEKTGLSVGFLSNLERDLSSPTLDNIQRICSVLEISLMKLLEEAQGRDYIIKKEEREVIFKKEGEICYESIKFREGIMDGIVIHIAPGCFYQREWWHNYDEMGLVLEGALTITIEHQSYILQTGDSFYIRAGTEHSICNHTDTPCSSYWVRLIREES